MSSTNGHDEHTRLLDELLKNGGLQALHDHERGCAMCQEVARQQDGNWFGPLQQAALEANAPGTSVPGYKTPRPPARGLNVPGYEVLEALGRGNYGVVYRALDLTLNRMVALKMMRAGAIAEELERFRVEAEAVARLQHPNIVQIYEIGEHDGTPYLALEYVPGGSLDRHLRGKPMPARKAAEMVWSLAQTMEHAHKRGIVHRDLKPANVLLAEDDTPKVTDFGMARLMGQTAHLTETGAVMGTPVYMAPEQAQGKARGQAVGPAADVWALGVMLYEMLTGHLPFQGDTPVEVLFQVVHGKPRPPHQLRAGIDPALEEICLRCLEKDPADRFPRALALAAALRGYLDHKRDWRNWLLAGSLATTAALGLFLVFGANWRPGRAEPRADENGAAALQDGATRIRELETRLGRAEKESAERAEKLRQAEREVEESKKTIRDQNALLAGLKAQVQATERYKETLQESMRRLQTDLDNARAEHALDKAKLDRAKKLAGSLALSRGEYDELAGRLRASEERIRGLEEQRQKAKEKLADAERQIAALKVDLVRAERPAPRVAAISGLAAFQGTWRVESRVRGGKAKSSGERIRIAGAKWSDGCPWPSEMRVSRVGESQTLDLKLPGKFPPHLRGIYKFEGEDTLFITYFAPTAPTPTRERPTSFGPPCDPRDDKVLLTLKRVHKK